VRRAGAGAWAAILLGAPLAVFGCGRRAVKAPERPTLVRTARVSTGTITDWVRLYGRIVPPPDRDATLAPQVAGVLVAVPVREGQAVESGAVLARVEPGPLDDAVRAAEAAERRAAAETEFRKSAAARTAALVDKGVASRQDAEQDAAAAVSAEAALAEASSALATARRRRGWAELRAPFGGVIVRVHRRPGDSVDGTPATPVVQVAAAAGTQVAAEATAAALTRLGPDEPAEVEATGVPGSVLRARVIRVARAVEAASGSGEVRLAFDGPAPDLPLGMGVAVRIAAARREGALVVPARALRRGGEGATEAVVVERGKAAVRTVVTGLSDGERVEILQGLSAGESVVVDDPVGLASGMPLEERP
jgi:multidrug efflux system membrane fusion protein